MACILYLLMRAALHGRRGVGATDLYKTGLACSSDEGCAGHLALLPSYSLCSLAEDIAAA